MQLGFLGSGKITQSIIHGILNSKIRVKTVYISYRNKEISKYLSKKFRKVKVLKNNQEIVNKSNIVFLAITPKVGHKILPKLKFQTNKKIISLISTIKLDTIKKYTKNKKVIRVIPLPFINMRKGPIIIFPKDSQIKKFFSNLGTVIEVNKENLSKGFWSTSSFMASFYNLLNTTSNWLTSKGVKKMRQKNILKNFF